MNMNKNDKKDMKKNIQSNDFVAIYKTDEEVRLTILTNVCRMMINRGYLDINKYKHSGNIKDRKRSPYLKSDNIDNDLFLKYIGKRTDDNVYVVPVDMHFKDEMILSNAKNNNNNFDGSKVVIKILSKKITDINNSPLVNEFLKKYTKQHKIIIFNEISDKAYKSILNSYNIEAFEKKHLMIDLMAHICAPENVKILNKHHIRHIINPKFHSIKANDPLCRYYNAKINDILRVIRPSANNSFEVGYYSVIEPTFGIFK